MPSGICEFCGHVVGGNQPQSHKLWVPGKPISYGAKGQEVRRAPKGLHEWEKDIGWEWIKTHGSLQLSGPVIVRGKFLLTNSMQDVDNLLKSLMDGLKKVAFGDDRLVYFAQGIKEPAPSKDGTGVMVEVAPWVGPVFETHL